MTASTSASGSTSSRKAKSSSSAAASSSSLKSNNQESAVNQSAAAADPTAAAANRRPQEDDEADELLDYEEDELLQDSQSTAAAAASSSFSLSDAKLSASSKSHKSSRQSGSQLSPSKLSNSHSGGSGVSQQNAASNKIKGAYSSIHSSGFRDFILRPELMKSIANSGFEHPSTVQHETIPQAILGMDILCQAKSGMGKTAVFVISTLQLLNPKHEETSVLVVAHTRELALQISKEFERFSKYLPVKVQCFLGGIPISKDLENLKTQTPHIVVGTPGRLLALINQKALEMSTLKHFIVDEADKVLSQLSMRSTVQQIFKATPKDKQTMMFSATMPKDMQDLCKKFMQDPLEVTIDDDKKLTLHGLHQYYLKLTEKDKNKKLVDILDALEFNQVMIFVKDARRATALAAFLKEQNFPTGFIHGAMPQEDRISRFENFKAFQTRIMVSTDLFGRGIDVNKVNVVINYDMPDSTDSYLHRVGRAGRFGTKGLALTFLADSNDCDLMNTVQSRFEVQIKDLPNTLDPNSYMEVNNPTESASTAQQGAAAAQQLPNGSLKSSNESSANAANNNSAAPEAKKSK